MASVRDGAQKPHPDAPDEDGPLELHVLYRRHARFVWLTLQRLGVREADAEDVAHDVFVVAHRKLGIFNHSARIATWLFGICLRLAANYRRQARNRLECLASEVRAPDPMAEGRGPDELVRLREAARRVSAALDGMDLTKRAVFVMFELEGIACDDIAVSLGIPVGTVYSRLRGARRIVGSAVRRADGKGVEGGA